MENSQRNPMFERRIQNRLKKMNRLNKIYRQQMHEQKVQENNRQNTEQKHYQPKAKREISRADLLNGLRMGQSYAMQRKLLERLSNTRSERQLPPKERERMRERTRERLRQREREGYTR